MTIYEQDLTGLPGVSDPKAHERIVALNSTLPLFQHIRQMDDVRGYAPLAEDWRQRFQDVIILGTGGSSLGGQSLHALVDSPSVQLHFMDNIDSHTFDVLLPKINPEKTGVLAISKSGNTAETLAQLLHLLPLWKNPKNHFAIVTESNTNAIRTIAETRSLTCFDHPKDIGGRFSVFTIVGMLPALLMGLSPANIRQAAVAVLDRAIESADAPPLLGASLQVQAMKQGLSQSVLMPYVDRLATFALWFRQLWAESLGKQGLGSTPIRAVGTVDQHSQLQLYLDGPKDKFFTLISLKRDAGTPLSVSGFSHDAVNGLHHKSLNQLMEAEERATVDTLRSHGCPTRHIYLKSCDSESLSALMMHYMVETIATAHLIGVDPFDQPAVEEGKVLTQKYLREV